MLRRSLFRLLIALLFLPFAELRPAAMYGMTQVESVPLERLIRNIEASISREPKNAGLLFNLARVHAMAFAKRMAARDPVEVQKFGKANNPWYGIGMFEPTSFPLVQTDDAKRLKEAKEHMEAAIEFYRQGITLDSGNTRAKLGYAWCIDQSGDRAKAITAYRSVISESWIRDPQRPLRVYFSDVDSGSWNPDLTAEAARYLIPLLDPEKDRDEIATLRDRVRMGDQVERGITPIVVPLREGVTPQTFLDENARVRFDADGSGLSKQWTWITPDAAWLVHAPMKSHPVTSALQFFGNVTFWLFWDNGYQALAALDDNGDGVLKDSELEGLGLWRDANRNGLAEEGEVRPLAEWGIVSLHCAHERTPDRRDYVAYSPKGVTFKDGGTRPTWDVLLYTRASPVRITE